MDGLIERGLDWFYVDVNLSDRKAVRYIHAIHGIGAVGMFYKLLTSLYAYGNHLKWNHEIAESLAEKHKMTLDVIQDIVNICLRFDFFDNELYKKSNILTSDEIKKNYNKSYYWRRKFSEREQKLVTHRYTPEYHQWRKAVLKRDNETCQQCGSQENLQTHHIKSYAKFKELRFDLDNGVTLCLSCHKKQHKKKNV
jgi:hypothetical protein